MSADHSAADNPLYQDFLRGAPGRPVIDKWHHYFDVYHQHFAPYRGRSPTVIEIGVQNGGSLHLWRSYFGDGARLFGLDIDPDCEGRGPPGSKVFIGDQTDPAVLARILAESGPPDIVIDDGGHRASQMIASFEVLYPRMREVGVYVVEDTHTQFWGGSWLDDPQGRNFLQYAVDRMTSLHDWTGKRASFEKLRAPPSQRREELPASDFCRTTASVAFYDSMIVFARRPRPEPWCDYHATPPAAEGA